jgi:serine/threonine protein kinase
VPLPQDPTERRYEVREQVGKGAFGTVSLVVDRETKKQ